LIEAADKNIDSLHSFMLVRHGRVVAEGWWSPYNAASPHTLYSLTKSFTSTAVGMAVAEGKLSIHDEVLKFFPDAAPADPSRNLKSMRVSDLLRMSAGHNAEVQLNGKPNAARAFLEHPVPNKPGTHFLYNTPASYMLSAIVQKATGTPISEYLRPRLFEPLGIENPIWLKNSEGVAIGGYGLSIRTEDIAKFGQLYLQKGDWNGKQLIPAAWVEAASSRQTSNGSNPKSDWEQGYGYQFWRCRHGFFRGDGAFGQYCVVMPEQDAVVAITSGVRNMQAVLDLLWDKLLPALHSAPLPADDEAAKRLQKTLASLTFKVPAGSAAPESIRQADGKKYVFPTNPQKLEWLSLASDTSGDLATLSGRWGGTDHRIEFGRGVWRTGRSAFGGFPEQPIAASGAWSDDGVFHGKLAFYETPNSLAIALRFAGDQAFFDSEWNVGFGPTKQPQLVGKRE
jgi:CubicO group peptidase (beta-lactamase class C family)